MRKNHLLAYSQFIVNKW